MKLYLFWRRHFAGGKSFGFIVTPLDSSKKLTLFTLIGGLLCHLCPHFHFFLDLLYVAEHLYPEVIPMGKVKSYFKGTVKFHSIF